MEKAFIETFNYAYDLAAPAVMTAWLGLVTRKKSPAKAKRALLLGSLPYNRTNSTLIDAMPAYSTRKYKKRPRSRKRKSKRATKRRRKTKVSTLSKRIRTISKFVKRTTATVINRNRIIDQCEAGFNQINICEKAGSSKSQLGEVLKTLRFFNPAVPGTYTTVDMDAVTNQQKYVFKKVSSVIAISNGSRFPCQVQLYLCRVKHDTIIPPILSITTGLVDVGGPSIFQTNVYPEDSNLFKQIWQVKFKRTWKLEPGQTRYASHSEYNCVYDLSASDTRTFNYQRDMKSFVWMYRVIGTNCHALATTTQVGTSKAHIDVIIDNTVVLDYEGGADIKWIKTGTDADVVIAAVKPMKNVELETYGI